jgi:hypothetical protein
MKDRAEVNSIKICAKVEIESSSLLALHSLHSLQASLNMIKCGD